MIKTLKHTFIIVSIDVARKPIGSDSVPRLLLISIEPQLIGLLLFPEGGRLRFDCILHSIWGNFLIMHEQILNFGKTVYSTMLIR